MNTPVQETTRTNVLNPTAIEIQMDTLASMQGSLAFQRSNGGKDIAKFKLSELSAYQKEYGVTPAKESPALPKIKPIVQFSPALPRYQNKVFRIARIEGIQGTTKIKNPRGKGKILIIAKPSHAAKIETRQKQIRTHVLATLVKKADSGTLGKPQASQSFPNRFKAIYFSTLNFSGNVQACLDIIAGEKSLLAIANLTKVINRKLFKLGQKMQAQNLHETFVRFTTGKKTTKAIQRALGLEPKESNKTPRDRKSVQVFITKGKGKAKQELTFVTENVKVNYITQYRKIEPLGIRGLDKKAFDTMRVECMRDNERKTLIVGSYTFLFVPIAASEPTRNKKSS